MKVDIFDINKKYGIVYTDPPWKQTKGNKRNCRPNQGKKLDKEEKVTYESINNMAALDRSCSGRYKEK